MLAQVKLALRITDDAFDDEVNDIIKACLADLKLIGVTRFKKGDSLILRAVVLCAKAHFGFNDDSEKYKMSYEAMRISLGLAGDYRV
jgi:hypothetical protein